MQEFSSIALSDIVPNININFILKNRKIKFKVGHLRQIGHMRKVYTIGETVYDIIFKDGKPADAKPGGALLNSAVSLGRLGADVSLVGDLADDAVGKLILKFLSRNGVKTDNIFTYTDAHSRLALAFLDAENNAEYSFYKIRKKGKAELNYPEINKGDIVLFGSFYAIKPELHDDLTEFIEKARNAGAVIVYDPNFRKAHLKDLEQLRPMIIQNMELAHIVKGSDEDFLNVFGTDNAPNTYEKVGKLTDAVLIYTANRHGVWLHTNNLSKHYDALAIRPVSTIGAGDTFNSGIAYGILVDDLNFSSAHVISEKRWDTLIGTSIQFSGHVCMHYDNYISADFARHYYLNRQ